MADNFSTVSDVNRERSTDDTSANGFVNKLDGHLAPQQQQQIPSDLPLKAMRSSSTSLDRDGDLRLAESKVYAACRTDDKVPAERKTFLMKLNAISDRFHFPDYILLFLVGAFFWANCWLLLGQSALPGGSGFALFFLCVFSWIGGEFIRIIHLPPLLGMLIIGFALRNLPVVSIAQDVHPQTSSSLRSIALSVILCRAGLSLDPQKLRKLRFTFVALSLAPCLLQAAATAVAAHLLLNFPWLWSFILGFVMAAVSPALVVPNMLICQDKGLGTNKGIPSLLIAAGSLDNVTSIAAFGIVLSITFTSSPLYMTILKGPLEVIIGVAFGAVIGTITWFFTLRIKRNRLLFQCLVLGLGCVFAIFGSRACGYSGAGPIGSLVLSFAAAHGWRKRGKLDKRISIVFKTIWLIFQPILFGLIGSEVKLNNLVLSTIGLGVAIIVIAVVFRAVVTFAAVTKTNFNVKEKLFVTLAWVPKATVQAAIGPVALDTARQMAASDAETITMATEVLNIAVLTILIVAPIGAMGIPLSAPRLLTKDTEQPTQSTNL